MPEKLLDGLKVLSFCHYLQGPAGVQYLAGLGADVAGGGALESVSGRPAGLAGRTGRSPLLGKDRQPLGARHIRVQRKWAGQSAGE